jgi:hypothetical protein
LLIRNPQKTLSHLPNSCLHSTSNSLGIRSLFPWLSPKTTNNNTQDYSRTENTSCDRSSKIHRFGLLEIIFPLLRVFLRLDLFVFGLFFRSAVIDTGIVFLTLETSLRAGVVASVEGEEKSSVPPVGFLLLVGFFLLGRSRVYADKVDALEALSGAFP